MAKYRKLPVEIEAFKLDINTFSFGEDRPDWFNDALHEGKASIHMVDKNGNVGFIETLEGKHLMKPNDYIIKGIKGEIYPCKPDIFEKTYEEVK